MNSVTHPTITVNRPGSPLPWLLLIAAVLIVADGISECPSNEDTL